MIRWFIGLLMVVVTSEMGRAHSIWVIPAAKGDSAAVVYSDSPRVDAGEPLKIFPTTTVALRHADGRVENLKGTEEKDVYRIACPGNGLQTLAVVRNRIAGNNKDRLQTYIAKGYLADPEGKALDPAQVPAWDALALDIVLRPDKGLGIFQVLYRGQPVEKSEVFLYRPGDSDSDNVPVFTTDKQGLITVKAPRPGRYGLLVNHRVNEKGMHEGKPFTERFCECSLVIEVPDPSVK